MSYQSAPEFFDDAKEHRRTLARILNGVLLGRVNHFAKVTLTASSTTTILTRPEIGSATIVILSPMSQSAAQALASGVVWATCSTGQITITHDSQPSTDRIFGVAYLG